MTVRRVTWRRVDDVLTDEHATLTIRDAGLSLVGTVIGAENGVPHRVEYRVMADGAGLTTAVHVRDLRGFEQRSLALERGPKGTWTVNGVADPTLRGCTDVDLGCTPATSTLPIRRLRLGHGSSKSIAAALVRFPELVVVRDAQTYTRLDESTYRRESDGIADEIVADDDGLVAASGAWRRTGLASGLDDTEPLDARR
jgi:hypothetical protein